MCNLVGYILYVSVTLLEIKAEYVVFHVEAARVDQLVELDGQDVRVAQDEGEDDGNCNVNVSCQFTWCFGS